MVVSEFDLPIVETRCFASPAIQSEFANPI
jgi:hypothetical protein